ncbi:hypothetical protein [Deinococcus rufus]|uniref:Uncharacterized protein n=1 Tax=Deinococcus rufus TaxID=2136097 RepID=A0ABV7Z7V2_9DEIO
MIQNAADAAKLAASTATVQDDEYAATFQPALDHALTEADRAATAGLYAVEVNVQGFDLLPEVSLALRRALRARGFAVKATLEDPFTLTLGWQPARSPAAAQWLLRE